MYVEDTIAAISTPVGEGGIGIIRISGGDAETIATAVFPHSSHGGLQSHRFYYGRLVDPDGGRLVDEVMLVLMRAPRSYTCEDVVEIQCHGGSLVTERVLGLVLRHGARLADPGEFTKRAFLNGRIDLLQAEAVVDIIRSKTEAALDLAQGQRLGDLSEAVLSIRKRLVDALAILESFIDFPEEELDPGAEKGIAGNVSAARDDIESLLNGFEEGRAIREGVSVLIAGKPNVGKSSLLNILLREKRAIVTSVPGTTRDIIEEVVNIGGLPVRLMDTAGIRETEDIVEREGVRLALEKIPQADLILFVLDNSRPFDEDDRSIFSSLHGKNVISVVNKSDLPSALAAPAYVDSDSFVHLSTTTGEGIDLLRQRIVSLFIHNPHADRRGEVLISRVRHRDALVKALHSLRRFSIAATAGEYAELQAVDLREAVAAVGEVTGQTTADELLDVIFSQFCIGK